jgi:hydroxymethylpyrimidine pyrophosphatase-like HAD family hydrolase
MRDIDLVVTDLDGTLWGADERVHDRTLSALRTLADRDVPVLVATGRRLSSAVATLGRSGIELPTVVLDGALGREVGPGRTFHRAAFDPADARAVLAGFREVGLSPCVYVDRPNTEVIAAGDASTHPAHLEHVGEWLQRRDDLESVVSDEQILMFAIVAAPEPTLAAVARSVGAHGAVAVTRDIIYGGATITVRPPGVSKWDGVLAWCADQGLDADRVLAVGDGENDLELLGAARVACVVSDGCEPALALADHVLEPACDGGWSAIVDLV